MHFYGVSCTATQCAVDSDTVMCMCATAKLKQVHCMPECRAIELTCYTLMAVDMCGIAHKCALH